MKTTLESRGLMLVAVPLVFEIAFVLILVSSLIQTEAKIDAQLRRQAMVEQTLILFRQLLEGSVFSFNALASMKKVDPKPLQASITTTLKSFDELVGEDSQLKDYALDIRKTTHSFLDMLNRYSRMELSALMENIASGGSVSTDLHKVIARLDKLVQKFSASALGTNLTQTASVEHGSQIPALISLGVILNFLLTIILSLTFARNISYRLNKLAENTRRVSLNLPPLPLLTGNDEISNLDLVIHRMSDQLQAAESQRKQLTSMLHSKLQEPLAEARRVFIDLQENAQLPPGALNHMKKSAVQLQRLINLLNDLTELRQVNSTEIELNRKEIPVDGLVNRAIEEIQSLARKKQLNITYCGPKLKFFGDDERLTQVLINLLSNAVKFSPQQESIVVQIADLDQDLEIRVIDNGPGIPEQQRAKIFERFEQTSRADATRHGGTGLGLNICSQIATAHGGILGVDSEPGKGSEFWLRMPVSLNRQNAARNAAANLQSSTAAASSSKRARSFRIWHKGLLVVAAPLVFQIIFLAILNSMIATAQFEARQEMKAMKITGAVNELYKSVISLGTSGFGFHVRSGAAEEAKNYKRAIGIMLEQFSFLFEQEKRDQSASEQLMNIFHGSQKLLLLTGKIMMEPSPDFSQMSSLARLRQEATILQKHMSAISLSLSDLLEHQKQIELKSPILRAKTKHSIEMLILTAVAASVLLSLLLGVFFSRNISSRVNILIENTLRFTKKAELLAPLSGNDELNSFDSDFRLMVKNIEENQEFKRQIIGVVSHELRAPLSSIVGALSLVLTGVFGELPKELSAPIQSAHDDIWRIVQLVNDLLDIERIEAGKYPLEISVFDIRQAAELSIAEASKFLPLDSMVIHNTRALNDENMAYVVEADLDLSSKAITKLLLFCAEGQTHQDPIQIDFGKENDYISIKISAPANLLAQNGGNEDLERFQLLDDSRQRRGVALALTLSSAIAALSGGSLTVLPASNRTHGYLKLLLPAAKAQTIDAEVI